MELSKTGQQRYFESAVEGFLESGNESIKLRELTNFEWEKACLVAPYGGFDRKENLPEGVKYQFSGQETYSDSDGLWLIVFISYKNETVYSIKPNAGYSRKQHWPSKCHLNETASVALEAADFFPTILIENEKSKF